MSDVEYIYLALNFPMSHEFLRMLTIYQAVHDLYEVKREE